MHPRKCVMHLIFCNSVASRVKDGDGYACLKHAFNKLFSLPARQGGMNVLVTEQNLVSQRHQQDAVYLETGVLGRRSHV